MQQLGVPPPAPAILTMYQSEEDRLAAVEALYDTYDWIDRDNCVQRNSAVGKILTYPAGTFYLGGSRRMKQLYEERAAGNATVLQNSPYKHLTGCNCSTDWDFYATYTPELEKILLNEMGFHESAYSICVRAIRKRNFEDLTLSELQILEDVATNAEYALDDEAISIWQKDNVQVVLRKDALFYKRVFDNIDSDVYETLLWKSSPTTTVDREMIQPLFNTFFKIAHAAESK